MAELARIQRLLDHLYWADRRLVEDLRGSAHPEPEALRLLGHVLASERTWSARLRGEDTEGLALWPPLSADECGAWADRAHDELQAYLEDLVESDLETPVRYRNSKGVELATAVGDILTHLTLHGSYHRGQIAAALRRAGGEPPDVDFITFEREGG